MLPNEAIDRVISIINLTALHLLRSRFVSLWKGQYVTIDVGMCKVRTNLEINTIHQQSTMFNRNSCKSDQNEWRDSYFSISQTDSSLELRDKFCSSSSLFCVRIFCQYNISIYRVPLAHSLFSAKCIWK